MGRKRMYRNAAEKQRAWRIKHGQKQKVPLVLRRGQPLGSSTADLRAKSEEESWEEYHEYILNSVEKAHGREKKAMGATRRNGNIPKPGGREQPTRRFEVKEETEFSEQYYELRVQYEKGLMELDNKRKKISKK